MLTCGALWPAAAAAGGSICHREATEGSGDTVAMSKSCFTPSVLRVEPGAQVTFVNEDPVPHNISAEWGRGAELLAGDTFHAFFDEEGTFPYACTYHYGMTGAIVVGDGAGPGVETLGTSGAVVDTTAVSQERTGSAQGRDSGILGWTVAGAIGLLVGAGATAMIRRRPEEG